MILFCTVKTVLQWFTALLQHLAIIQPIEIMLCFHCFMRFVNQQLKLS